MGFEISRFPRWIRPPFHYGLHALAHILTQVAIFVA